MSAQHQIERSRVNGATFRGPVTVRGKAPSSRDHVHNGLAAETSILPKESPFILPNPLTQSPADRTRSIEAAPRRHSREKTAIFDFEPNPISEPLEVL
jgi:hypothetical protein